jgi:hypothetical protein
MAKLKTVRPLDIVRTPKGAIALITECDERQASITFFPNQEPTYEKNAWWDPNELHILGSLPTMLANEMAHPFGSNKDQGDKYYGS